MLALRTVGGKISFCHFFFSLKTFTGFLQWSTPGCKFPEGKRKTNGCGKIAETLPQTKGAPRGMALPQCEHKPHRQGERGSGGGRGDRATLQTVPKWKILWWRLAVWGITFQPILMVSVLSPSMTNHVWHGDALPKMLCFCLFSVHIYL